MPVNFRELRDLWALKMPVSEGTILLYLKIDQQANPHGDNHKSPRRSEAQVHSDCVYGYADEVLIQQYGHDYYKWLENATTPDEKKRVRRYQRLDVVERNF